MLAMDCRETPERNALMLNGWPTPPLTSNEGRRPSLAFSTYSDPSYGSSASNYSQPSTPGQSMHSQGRPMQPLCNQNLLRSNSQLSHYNSSHAVSFTSPCQASPNQHYSNGSYPCGLTTAPTSIPNSIGLQGPMRTAPHAVWQDFGTSFDNAQLHHQNGAMHQNLMHNDTSFDRSQSCGPALYNHPTSSIDAVANMPSFDQCHHIPTGVWPDQQVVVPSQLSPDDELGAYHYTTPELVDSQFSTSFDSSASGYSGYDTIEPPSPDHAYFAPSDEEVVFVKPEPFNSPTPGSGQWAGHSLPYRSSFQIPLSKARKRSTKRRRKTVMPGEAYKTALPGHSSRRDLIEVRIDPKVSFDNEGKPLLAAPNAKKPHVCTKVVGGQQCGRSFERSEHLKRHMSSHSTEKQYPCPLRRYGLCKMAIARPDNACDHFKTHLKTKRKGQRNKDVNWETMEAAILDEYPADKANKLLTNLRKWKQSNQCK